MKATGCGIAGLCVVGMVLLPAGCSHDRIRYDLVASTDGSGANGTAEVVDRSHDRPLRPDLITWAYDGEVAGRDRLGHFSITGPNGGRVTATFATVGGTRSLAVALPGIPERPIAPSPLPTTAPSPAPTALPTPEPTATPVPATPLPSPTVALQDDAGLVELAYRQASLGNHVEALGTLARISDPGYGPKVQSLIRLWGGDAANELVGEAQRLLALGQVEQARQGLARALTLPASPATRRKAQALLDDLKGNPGTK